MALRDGLGEKVFGVDTSMGMLDKFDERAEGKGVTTIHVMVRASSTITVFAGAPSCQSIFTFS